MTIKQQVQELLESYKSDFLSKTGIKLIVFPDTTMEKAELIKLREETERILEIKIIKSNKAEQVRVKRFFIRAAVEMGYIDKEIALCIGLDRTSVTQHKNDYGRLRGDMQNERDYAKYKSELLKVI